MSAQAPSSGRLLRFAAQVAGRLDAPALPPEPEQFDLFSGGGIPPAVPPVAPAAPAALPPAELTDAALLAAIPEATQAACRPLAEEAVRRRLPEAAPALEALCRRFSGFGQHRPVPEQVAAVQALAALGGAEAVAAIRRIIVQGIVAGPGLPAAVHAAAVLRCRLPADTAADLLRHPDPATRADACRCAPRAPAVMALLAGLLEDLHAGVATSAAVALARMGRDDGRPLLLRCLRQAPDAATIDAVVAIADEECVVLLGRVARQHPPLREAVLEALESIDLPRAATVLAALGGA